MLLVDFRTKKLRQWFESSKAGQRALGPEIAREYIQRIGIIQKTRDWDELLRLPALNCHPLSGDLHGLYSIKLTGFYRLIVSFEGEVVTIEEVSKHYGD